MNPALAALLSHPAIWRGRDCAPEPAALPTGFAALDAALPGGGWPGSALTEVLLAREGIGEVRLALPALARLTRAGHHVAWIAPPYRPYGPALAAAGVDLSRLVLVRCRDAREALWAFEQALRAPECGAAFAWLAERDERMLRRLALAAREGRTWGVLWRRPDVAARATAAALRLGLEARGGRLAVSVLKRRGGELAQPIVIDLAARWSTAPAEALARPGFAPRLPPRPREPRPDPRSRAGREDVEARLARARRAGAAN
jgi:cell division inhibitor SulA